MAVRVKFIDLSQSLSHFSCHAYMEFTLVLPVFINGITIGKLNAVSTLVLLQLSHAAIHTEFWYRIQRERERERERERI